MSALIWAVLLFSVRSNHAESGPSVEESACADEKHFITLSKREITAEAGLCVVLPCNVTTADNFTVRSVIWYKCDQNKTDCNSDVIFDTSNIDKNQTGRVSLLEPDLSKKNCSIIVNDLTESDSGSYQLIVNVTADGEQSGCILQDNATISVTDLNPKPTVIIPPLIEGQQTTLTCIAPGGCSGSVPTITWMWRETGKNKTGNVSTVNQTQSSTLTFNPSAEQHGTQVTCKVGFTGNKTTEETVTLNVTYIKITGNTTVKKGEALNLTCSVVSFSPFVISWTEPNATKKHKEPKTDQQNNTETNLMNDIEANLKDDNGTKGETDTQNKTVIQMQNNMLTLFIPKLEHSGQYICTAKHLNTTLTTCANITVIQDPIILNKSGCEKTNQSKDLTCVCISEGPPLPNITWPLLKNHNEYSVITTVLNHTVTSTITLTLKDHSDTVVECVSRNENGEAKRNLTISERERLEEDPIILNKSGCEKTNQSKDLTCVCISEGPPLPNITWPLLKNHNEYSVITTVLNYTVNSTITLTLKDHSDTVVECVSRNENGEAKRNLTISERERLEDQLWKILEIVQQTQVIIAFLIGIILSSFICCLARKCHRKKHKSSENLAESLEMETMQAVPLMPIDGDQVVEDDGTHNQEAAEGEAEAAGQCNMEPKDVEYSAIDFSMLQRRSLTHETQDTTETEYAEIKKEETEERQDNGEEEAVMLDGNEEVMMEEDKEIRQCMPAEEEGGQDLAMCSDVTEIVTTN